MTETSLIDVLKAARDAVEDAIVLSTPQASPVVRASYRAIVTTLEAHIARLESPELVEVGKNALLDLKIPDGFDRNGSHSEGGYREYEWSLRQYLRPQDEWKAEGLAKAAIDAVLGV